MAENSHERNRTIAIGGPTAVGKTAAAIALAQKLNGEIISADSAAVYRGVDIGTAKPSREEQGRARFHLIDVADPERDFSVAEFKRLAKEALAEIHARGNAAIVAGGTGFYLRALLEDYGLTATPADSQIRETLNQEADERGAAALHGRLADSDPKSAARIHPNDRKRIIRALEVLQNTGIPISEQQETDRKRRNPSPSNKCLLNRDRAELYARIENRVEEQLTFGLEQEVRVLLSRGISPERNSLRSLGYKEMAAYILGEISYEEAVEAIKKNTRRFARRQLTWFRAEPDWTWIDVGGKTPEQTAEAIMELLPQT